MPSRKRVTMAVLSLLMVFVQTALAIEAPRGVVSRVGDRSVVLHWDRNTEADLAGYQVYRALTNTGPFTLQGSMVTAPGYCDLAVNNGQAYHYRVTAVSAGESLPSATIVATPRAFADDNEFLDYVQQTGFDYFWYAGNPVNGLVPDRSSPGSACSIAAVGFGLSAICIGVDHGWVTRSQAAARVMTTLDTFLDKPQGSAASGVIGYKGWFYHFIDMNTGLRSPNSELSSIDTVLLLGGVLDAKQYFDGTNITERAIRDKSAAIFNRIDWNWMARNTNVVSMGWFPGSGFISSDWIGYNEAMIVYVLGLGAATNPLPASVWSRWTSGYSWATHYGQSYVAFPPLFGHQYSHCWVDFRHIADAYMTARSSTYFENSRRAALAQRAYCIANPSGQVGYGSNAWGLTACDGPNGYGARGAPNGFDDGTIAPTAAGASMPFTPEYSVPTLLNFYTRSRPRIWTAYGFRDAFNVGAQWYATDVLGIDQGPIVLMIENYRTQRVWRRFMANEEVQRGLQRAGFVPLTSMLPRVEPRLGENAVVLSWNAPAGRAYGVEYSADLLSWFGSPTGAIASAGSVATWTDQGPPGTASAPFEVPQRFYRVFQFGIP